ncbi:hypothetical protein N185_32455 [Sinorhizobium sp. GW3]|nr:hypothetical protein N185_32455 [Sinorhizobium sp. GW3]
MYPSRFDYVQVESFSAASDALIQGGADAKLMAGGQTLIPMMKLRLLSPKLIIDIGAIKGASDVLSGEDLIEIGALARHNDVGKSEVARRHDIIRDCSLGIADTQVRNMGTIGGSVAEADPCGCWATLLTALDAVALCQGPQGERVQSVRTLLADAYTPALDAGEIITRFAIPRAALNGLGTFVAFKRSAPAYPTASCALQVDLDGAQVTTLHMSFGCLGMTALPFDEANDLAAGRTFDAALARDIGDAAFEFVQPIEDNKGSEAYKRSLARGLVIRAFDIISRRQAGAKVRDTHQYYG